MAEPTNALAVFRPEIQAALKKLRRHSRGIHEAFEVLFKHRKLAKLLFPPGFNPGELLYQTGLLIGRPSENKKTGRPTKRDKAFLSAWLRQVDAVKLSRGWLGHGSDKQAITEIIDYEWVQSGLANAKTPDELKHEYTRRREWLADARRICGKTKAKIGLSYSTKI